MYRPLNSHLANSWSKINFLRKLFSTDIPKENKLFGLELKGRSLVKLTGPDSLEYLQGLITNDVKQLENKPSLFTLFLNQQGRVIFDVILYSLNSKEKVLIECDSSLKDRLLKHLKIYKIRRKVEAKEETSLKVWTVYNPKFNKGIPLKEVIEEFPFAVSQSERIFADPRISLLGWRILSGERISEELEKQFEKVSESDYKQFRFSLGVGEGSADYPLGNCFPLESNGDYLQGISFHKGCYIGQELTARTHHTGVVRKRLMPFWLPEEFKPKPEIDIESLKINNDKGKLLGKVRDISGKVGLALFRIDESLATPQLLLEGSEVKVEKPCWWNPELTKD